MFFLIGGVFQFIGSVWVEVPGWSWQAVDGLITFVLGVLVLAQWPASGLWVIGLFIDADAETKVYWKSPDGNARTTIIPGKGIQTFQTAGEFRLEAIGEPNREVQYGYVWLGLRK